MSRSRPAKKRSSRSRKRSGGRGGARRSGVMVFTRRNYTLLFIGLALVVSGYVIMRLENEVDGFISLYVAPLLILGGYLEIMYAIMWRPAGPDSGSAESEASSS